MNDRACNKYTPSQAVRPLQMVGDWKRANSILYPSTLARYNWWSSPCVGIVFVHQALHTVWQYGLAISAKWQSLSLHCTDSPSGAGSYIQDTHMWSIRSKTCFWQKQPIDMCTDTHAHIFSVQMNFSRMHTLHGSKKHTKGASYSVAVFFERSGVAGRVSRISIVLLPGSSRCRYSLFSRLALLQGRQTAAIVARKDANLSQ